MQGGAPPPSGRTCEELRVEHVDGLVVPRVLALQVDGVQQVLDEGGQDHGEQDGVLGEHSTLRPSTSSQSGAPAHSELRGTETPLAGFPSWA